MVTSTATDKAVAIKLRLPSWTKRPTLSLNGKPIPATGTLGYAMLHGRLRQGDRIVLTLPMALYKETTPDNPNIQAYLYGPMVLAADLGRDGEPLLPDEAPAVFAYGDRLPDQLLRATGSAEVFSLATTTGTALTLRPFYRQWNNRTAVYFEAFQMQDWPAEAERRATSRAGRQSVFAGAVDMFMPGDRMSENAHAYADERTELTPYRGRRGRLIKAGGGFIEADLKSANKPLTLYVTYWGEAERGMLDIRINGQLIATQKLNKEKAGDFFEAAYAIPAELSRDKATLRLRLEPQPNTRGPSVYGVRIA